MNLRYLLHSGKNSNLKFYLQGYARHLIPKRIYMRMLPAKLKEIKERPDWEYIRQRVDYYCKHPASYSLMPLYCSLCSEYSVGIDAPCSLKDFDLHHQDAYFLDLYRSSRWFPGDLKCGFVPGDVTEVPRYPSIVKSRPIHGNNANSVILKLDSARHFLFINDKIPFQNKMNRVIFRGQAYLEHRLRFLRMYYGHPLVDAGIPAAHHRRELHKPEWKKEPMTLYDHLKYKFIIAIEGTDVASNLKWVMSSNSIAVMPQPKYETWFMEGTLIPNYHYIEIKPDYSDLEERINYYIEHEDEAMEIINHAHQYVSQFRDSKREKLIEIKVLDKYFYGE